ncbi:MAG: hypothetical protein ACRDA0_12595 [Cetobacterium sp.]|uniref:hypothetical protein n=1 Tax=Cetobacterium sp. TaxID=2071632 RepID=UPI003F3A9242
MNSKSKGQEFFATLTQVEQQVIAEIMKVENDSKRLSQTKSTITEEKIKNIIEKYCFIRRD